jgi:hypothetical protein
MLKPVQASTVVSRRLFAQAELVDRFDEQSESTLGIPARRDTKAESKYRSTPHTSEFLFQAFAFSLR